MANFVMTHLRCTQPGLKVKQISFAGKLKDVSFQLYGWAGLKRAIYYETHWEEKEVILPKLGLSPRDTWIGVGNKIRGVYQNTWIDFALKGVEADIVLITDLRFWNEAKALWAEDAMLVKIIRDGIPKGTDPAEVDLDTWTDWDLQILNNCGLEELNDHAVQLAEEVISA